MGWTREVVVLITAALIRWGEQVLLVEQQGPDDLAPSWALPGGVARDGELLDESLRREVTEETGLALGAIDLLAYVAQLDDPQTSAQSIAFVFETSHWTGELRISDPDGLIRQTCWLPVEQAIERLKALPWRRMREPLLAYLGGESKPGSVWLYRRRPDGNEELLVEA